MFALLWVAASVAYLFVGLTFARGVYSQDKGGVRTTDGRRRGGSYEQDYWWWSVFMYCLPLFWLPIGVGLLWWHLFSLPAKLIIWYVTRPVRKQIRQDTLHKRNVRTADWVHNNHVPDSMQDKARSWKDRLLRVSQKS